MAHGVPHWAPGPPLGPRDAPGVLGVAPTSAMFIFNGSIFIRANVLSFWIIWGILIYKNGRGTATMACCIYFACRRASKDCDVFRHGLQSTEGPKSNTGGPRSRSHELRYHFIHLIQCSDISLQEFLGPMASQ